MQKTLKALPRSAFEGVPLLGAGQDVAARPTGHDGHRMGKGTGHAEGERHSGGRMNERLRTNFQEILRLIQALSSRQTVRDKRKIDGVCEELLLAAEGNPRQFEELLLKMARKKSYFNFIQYALETEEGERIARAIGYPDADSLLERLATEKEAHGETAGARKARMRAQEKATRKAPGP